MNFYQDIVYMRFMKDNKVFRVARADTQKGLVLALYPSNNKDIFYTEAFQNMDDVSEKQTIRRNEIKDNIWIRLLDGETHEAITADYEANSYCKRGAPNNEVLRSRVFRIAKDSEEAA